MSKRFALYKVVMAIAWLFIAGIGGISLWAFGIDRYDPVAKRYFDGFGRELGPSVFPGPYGRELSPSLLWCVVDTVVAFILMLIIGSLFMLAERLKASERDSINNDVSTGS